MYRNRHRDIVIRVVTSFLIEIIIRTKSLFIQVISSGNDRTLVSLPLWLRSKACTDNCLFLPRLIAVSYTWYNCMHRRLRLRLDEAELKTSHGKCNRKAYWGLHTVTIVDQGRGSNDHPAGKRVVAALVQPLTDYIVILQVSFQSFEWSI